MTWTCTEADLVSISHNTPFQGQKLTVKALGIVSGKMVRVVSAVNAATVR